MIKQSVKVIAVSCGFAAVIFTTHAFANTSSDTVQETIVPFPEETTAVSEPIEIIIEAEPVAVEEPEPVKELQMSDEDINLLARITMAEAEGESEKGQRLVIDTVLNRVDSSHFPNTVSGVVYQKNQFSPIQDGRFDKCYVKDDIRNLVIEELESRTDSDVVFFRTRKYSKYGSPLFKEGNHYFSSYN